MSDIDEPIVPAGPDPEADPANRQAPTAKPTRNQHMKVEDPKCDQFTGRATRAESDRIKAALAAQKREGEPMDIVRLTLLLLDQVEKDGFPFQSFKTK